MNLAWLSHLALATAVTGAAWGAWQWAASTTAPTPTPTPIERVEAPAITEHASLIDVRTAGEFARSHVQGAHNIPLGQLHQRLDELGPKSQLVYLYCRSGSRSSMAKRMLEQAGFANVIDLGSLGHARQAMKQARAKAPAAGTAAP